MDNQTAHSTVLGNGLTVVTRTAKDAVSTDIAIKIMDGSRDEVADNDPRGKRHVREHMVCAGSENHPTRARLLIESMKDFDSERFGHHFTPATQFYFTNYDARVPAASTYDVLDIMVDMISRPLYRKRDVDVEKKYILNERLGNQISFNSGNLERWIVPYIAHGENPLLYPVIGNKEGI
jgi:predicted Zn-dependent peptidase